MPEIFDLDADFVANSDNVHVMDVDGSVVLDVVAEAGGVGVEESD